MKMRRRKIWSPEGKTSGVPLGHASTGAGVPVMDRGRIPPDLRSSRMNPLRFIVRHGLGGAPLKAIGVQEPLGPVASVVAARRFCPAVPQLLTVTSLDPIE